MTLEELRALPERLRPWHEALQDLGDHVDWGRTPDPHGDRVVWLTLMVENLEGRGEEMLPRISEALVLLRLLMRVDCRVWATAVQQIWPESAIPDWVELQLLDGREDVARQCEFGLSVTNVEKRPHVALITKHNASRAKPSAEYVELFEYLMEKLGAADSDDDVKVPTRVEVETMDGTRAPVLRALKYVLAGVKAQKVKHVFRNHKPFLEIQVIAMSSTLTCPELGLEGFDVLRDMSGEGVQLEDVPELGLPAYDKKHLQITEALRSLLGESAPGVNSFVVSSNEAPSTIESILTAMQVSQKLRIADIRFDGDNSTWLYDPLRELWEWVSYTLLSRHANHKISTLQLDLDFFDDVHAQCATEIAVSEHDPLSLIMEVRPTDGQPKFIVSKRFALSHPDDETNAKGVRSIGYGRCKPFYQSEEPIKVRVAGKDGFKSWWVVLLPGHGRAWVHEEDVLSTADDDELLTDRDAIPGFERIDIVKINETSFESSVSLLKVIGHSTKCIDVFQQVVDIDDEIELDEFGIDLESLPRIDDWCHAVFKACPQLETFYLRKVLLRSLDIFTESAFARTIRLKDIRIEKMQVDKNGSIQRFFGALCDPRHPLTQRLETLDIKFSIYQSGQTDIIVPFVQEMLEKNSRLRSIKLEFDLRLDGAVDVPHLENAFDHKKGTGKMVRLGPLDMSKKAAFLSVLQHERDRTEGLSCVGQLDSNVVSQIFQFAAHGIRRKLTIQYFDWDEFKRCDLV